MSYRTLFYRRRAATRAALVVYHPKLNRCRLLMLANSRPEGGIIGNNLRFETNDEGIDLIALGFRNAEGVQRGIHTRHKRRVVSRGNAHPIVVCHLHVPTRVEY